MALLFQVVGCEVTLVACDQHFLKYYKLECKMSECTKQFKGNYFVTLCFTIVSVVCACRVTVKQ